MRYFLSKYITPLLWKYIKGSKRYEIFHNMQKLQWNSIEENLELQKEKLFKVLDYSIKNIPYYKRIAQEDNIKISEDTIFQDVEKFPVLTKEMIRENFNDLMNRKIPAVENSSGGSTGEPVILMQDKSAWDYGAASKMLFYEWGGRRRGELSIKLWGSLRDVLKGGDGFSGFLYRNFSNVLILNSFKMKRGDMKKFVEIINDKKPKVILAFVQSVYELARYIKNNNLKVFSPSSVITSAGNLYPDIKKLIEDVFKCPVLNRYGSREVGNMACSCKKNDQLHLNIFNHYFEVLKKDLNKAKKGESGEVHVTTLNNFAMPLIRYKLGDVCVVAEEEKCSCGRGMPLIKRIQGRDVNLFKKRDGTIVDGEFFTRPFCFQDWVRNFQVVQKDYDLIEFNVVLNRKVNEEEMIKVERDIRTAMGDDCRFMWNFVEEIQPTKSGKFLYTISNIK